MPVPPTHVPDPGQRERHTEPVGTLVDHFFRHEWANLVALITHGLGGLRYMDLAEDVVQEALIRALERWAIDGLPREPRAWLYRVARNLALDRIRRDRVGDRVRERIGADAEDLETSLERLFMDGEVRDGQLRMIFACCHPALPAASQLALTLKTLCGLSVREIARCLLSTEANVEKRIYRARQQFREGKVAYSVPTGAELAERLNAVCTALYLLFSEGYAATEADDYIRRDLCYEAMRLGRMLLDAPQCDVPRTRALVSLMCLQAARFPARLDADGAILLLAEQDRRLWDRGLIDQGMRLLAASAAGSELSAYHLEAGIAATHCLAPSWEATDWAAIVGLYDQLLVLRPSPLQALNRAIAVAQRDGAAAGLAAVAGIANLADLETHPILHATRGELHARRGDTDAAIDAWLQAWRLTRSPRERELIGKKLASIGGPLPR